MICSREANIFKAENSILPRVKNEGADQYFPTNGEKVLCDFSHSYTPYEVRSACVYREKKRILNWLKMFHNSKRTFYSFTFSGALVVSIL